MGTLQQWREMPTKRKVERAIGVGLTAAMLSSLLTGSCEPGGIRPEPSGKLPSSSEYLVGSMHEIYSTGSQIALRCAPDEFNGVAALYTAPTLDNTLGV